MQDKKCKPPEREILERLRRIETRVTQFMIASGVKTHAQRPEFEIVRGIGTLSMPSRHTTMKEALDSIPQTWEGPVNVFVGDDRVATISRPRDRS